jgi:hypothetical protein
MKNLWPKWIPYPVSIVRATVVCGVFILFIRLVASSIQEEVLYWHYYRGQIPDELIGAIFLGWIIILPTVAFLRHWVSGLFDEKYYQNHHPFIPGWRSVWEGLIALFVATLGLLIMGLVLPSSAVGNVWIACGFWFASVAYAYHIGYLFGEWRADRRAIKAERKAARKKANEEARAAKELAKAEKRSLKSRKQPAIAPSTEAVFDEMLKAIAEKETRGRRR